MVLVLYIWCEGLENLFSLICWISGANRSLIYVVIDRSLIYVVIDRSLIYVVIDRFLIYVVIDRLRFSRSTFETAEKIGKSSPRSIHDLLNIVGHDR